MSAPMNLARLLPELSLPASQQIEVRGLTLDSRHVQPGDAFVALRGERSDGRAFIDDAVAAGAAAILVEEPPAASGAAAPVVTVPALSQRLSELGDRFYGAPSRALDTFAVTGTNGKTTCALLMAQLAAHVSGRSAVLGTLGHGLLEASGDMAGQLAALAPTGLTTPDALTVQRIIRQLADAGAPSLAMEVSSHSLVQRRVSGVRVPAALFTNLSRDHLDYHASLADYGEAKARLLQQPGLAVAILNADDAWARGLAEQVPAGVAVVRYSLTRSDAEVRISECMEQRSGMSALVHTPWGEGELHSPLLGEFNLSNLLGVLTLLGARGLPLNELLEAVPKLLPAPGRMQPVVVNERLQDVQVVVDYAHTPDALENTLRALRHHNTGRLWCVFGCGGDRDRGKRPEMGRVAERLSDYVIVTNDNPRTEDPARIAADILRGMHNDHQCLVIADRAQAIDLAVQQARAGDTVLVAGKGHETDQVFADQVLAFSDTDAVRDSLARRLNKRGEASA